MNQNKNGSKKQHPGLIWSKVGNQWEISLSIFAAPFIIIPLIACVFSLYFATYQITDQSFSVVLNIIAALLLAVASGGIWDAVKNIMGNTLLIKKGNSAVRNLSLSRLKVKNISERTKMNAPPEEIMNLLGLLEKDVANSLQEWNDILPGVANIEVVYSLLAEKENELSTASLEKEELNNRLVQEKKFQDGEKEKLQEDFFKMSKKVSELTQEIGRLQTQVVTPYGYSGYYGYAGSRVTPFPFPGMEGPSKVFTIMTCSKCGKSYQVKALGDKGLCPDCE